MEDEPELLREKIRRYRALLQQHSDPAARKALQDLIREAEEKLGRASDQRS